MLVDEEPVPKFAASVLGVVPRWHAAYFGARLHYTTKEALMSSRVKTSAATPKRKLSATPRRLQDLAGIGPAAVADLTLLGVHSVRQLAESNGLELYERLCLLTNVQHDICCLDVFRCAIAQARDPDLPPEQRNWWYWSQLRKRSESMRHTDGEHDDFRIGNHRLQPPPLRD
jgi:hypothetical protein